MGARLPRVALIEHGKIRGRVMARRKRKMEKERGVGQDRQQVRTCRAASACALHCGRHRRREPCGPSCARANSP